MKNPLLTRTRVDRDGELSSVLCRRICPTRNVANMGRAGGLTKPSPLPHPRIPGLSWGPSPSEDASSGKGRQRPRMRPPSTPFSPRDRRRRPREKAGPLHAHTHTTVYGSTRLFMEAAPPACGGRQPHGNGKARPKCSCARRLSRFLSSYWLRPFRNLQATASLPDTLGPVGTEPPRPLGQSAAACVSGNDVSGSL